MSRKLRGQSMVELALCAPILMLLALGAAAAVQLADARAGLEAATQAAAAVAARAPNALSAQSDAEQRFQSMIAPYPLRSPVIQVALGGFGRADQVVATASGDVNIAWAAFFLPGRVSLKSTAVVHLEPWRTHRAAP
jgi:Flp pilus assembly protein TadG